MGLDAWAWGRPEPGLCSAHADDSSPDARHSRAGGFTGCDPETSTTAGTRATGSSGRGSTPGRDGPSLDSLQGIPVYLSAGGPINFEGLKRRGSDGNSDDDGSEESASRTLGTWSVGEHVEVPTWLMEKIKASEK